MAFLRCLFLFFLPGALVLSCARERGGPDAANPVPYVTVNRQINMDHALYSKLHTPGGYIYLDDEGYKGMIVVRDYNDMYFAHDRACPYHPDEACAKVTVDKGGLSMLCGKYNANNDFEACCGSKFSLDGNIMAGPTQFPLRSYVVNKNGSMLVITN